MEIDLAQRNASLYKFWERSKNKDASRVNSNEWNEQVYYLSQSGVGTEEALRYLYSKQPSYETFIDWLLHHYQHSNKELQVLQEDVLTKEDWDCWNKNGYLVIKNAVSATDCAAAQAAIWDYLDADPLVPESWYKLYDGKNGMMLSFFQHLALSNNRNTAKIRKVYEELYNSKDIYLLIDKVSFNPPETDSYKFTGSQLHWDVSLELPIPFVLQGLLYLNDVAADDGAFHCVPGFHNEIDKWIAGMPENTDVRSAALKDLKPVAIPGNAGDLIIWHQALPHCATPNSSSLPRMVQYIAYKPIKTEERKVWK